MENQADKTQSISYKNAALLANSLPPVILSFNGAHLGKYEFSSVISWCYPCNAETSGRKTVLLYAMLSLGGHTYPIILKRNCSGNNDQIVIDELKPLFGLTKMGTHQIRLHGIPRKYYPNMPWILNNGQPNCYVHPQWSEYFIFRANTTNLNGRINFVPMLKVDSTLWLPTDANRISHGHKQFFYEIQKILLFRSLFKITDTNLSNILIKPTSSRRQPLIPMSIDEMTIKLTGGTYRGPPQNLEQYFFPRTTTHTEILVRMLGLTRESYMDQIEIIRNSMSQIITRISGEKLWMVNIITEYIADKASVYFSLINGT